MNNDLNIESSGAFHVEQVPGGIYRNVTLHAHGSGSIHAKQPLTVEGKLTIKVENSATVLLPAKVKCNELELTNLNSSTINSDDLEVGTTCKVDVERSSTCGLYMVLACPLSGAVKESSTLNTWIHWAVTKKPIEVDVDSGSVFTERDWKGP
jgi:hypothetical protein